MNRIETVRDNWTEIITKLLNDKQELVNFLRFSSKMYNSILKKELQLYSIIVIPYLKAY